MTIDPAGAAVAPAAGRLRTGVYLTQFRGGELTGFDGRPLDWSDHRAAHHAIMRLFGPRLAGDAEVRRAKSGILYRLDVATNGDGVPETTILVQSLVAPEMVPPTARSIEISHRAWAPEVGEQIAFRIAINPVRRTTRTYADRSKSSSTLVEAGPGRVVERDEDGNRIRGHQKQTASVVGVDDIPGWLATKLDGALGDIQIIAHARDTFESRTGQQECSGTKHRVIVDTIDAVATVTDPATLDALRREGIGRSKAYGCGLLTIKRFV